LGEIDRRVRYLSKRLPDLKVVDTAPSDREAVFFGAQVELENIASGETVIYRIVGPDETDAKRGWISIDAPLARVLLKKRIDDDIEVQLPSGTVRFAIIEVRYLEA
jgi:transcription elongation factor GreB